MWVVFLLCASAVGLHVFCPFVLTNVSTEMTHESKHRGHLLQVQTAQRRNASFNAPSDERPQTQIRFARHTFATVLKRSGVSVALISESLGHSDLSTTQIYLDSFENSQIDAAMQHLL